MTGPTASLPPLREELVLHSGPRDASGAPTWTLYDPPTGRFFRITWAEFEMLARWHLGNPRIIAAAVARETPLPLIPAQVEEFLRFLANHGLIRVQGEKAIEHLRKVAERSRPPWALAVLKKYLFFRIPLVRPDRFLDATLPLVAWLFTPGFLLFSLIAGLLGFYLASRQWDAFLTSFLYFFTPLGALVGLAALIGTKIVHELGHAYAARLFGCRVSSMGVAFMVLWPVLFTDTTDAWRLTSRRQRLVIGAAGMLAELCLACFATLAWSFLPDGPLRSAAFVAASSTWIVTLAINLNPLMRFDGYYLLSDALEIPNLQGRAFALARWRLREWVFAFGDPAPERFAPATRRILLLYAYATWIYRFFLFLGIALLVYHLFFKLLGLVLMAVEIGWFILHPIGVEFREWLRRRDRLRLNRTTAASLTVAAGLLGLFLLPWQGRIDAPALFRAERQTQLFAPLPGRLVERPAVYRRVAEGEALFRFAAPDIEHALAQAQRSVDLHRARALELALAPDRSDDIQRTWRELEAAQAEVVRLRTEAERSDLVAPFSGVLTDMAEPLASGDWLAPNTWLATLVDPSTGLVEAYVAETDLGRVEVGAAGRFIPDLAEQESLPVRVVSIADAGTRVLKEPVLASVHGGAIPTRLDADGALVPEEAVYRVVLAPEPAVPAPARLTRGRAVLDGAPESLAARFWRRVLGVALRESGF